MMMITDDLLRIYYALVTILSVLLVSSHVRLIATLLKIAVPQRKAHLVLNTSDLTSAACPQYIGMIMV